MQEFIGAPQVNYETGVDGFPECRVHHLLCFPVNQGQDGDLGDIAQAGELYQGILGGSGEPLQLSGHEIHHVVGVALGANVIDVPAPGGCDGVEREQTLFGQCREKLDREERIAAGLLVHQLRQGLRALRLAVQGIGNELSHIGERERLQLYLM